MLPRVRTLLLGAGMSGAMAFLAPAAHAIDGLILEEEQLAAHNGDSVRAVGFAADGVGGDWVISGGEDATLRSWTLQLVEERVQLLDHTVYDLESSIDGSIVATGEGGWNGGTSTDTLRIWSADAFEAGSADGPEVGTGAPIGFVYVVAISPSPDNRFTAASGFYGEILIYDTASLELYATKATGKKRTKAIAFSPDGTILASTWKGGAIQLWSFPQANPDGTHQCAPQSCELVLLPVSMNHSGTWDLSIAFSPDSTSEETKLVSGSDSGMVKVWTIENPHEDPIVTVQSVDSGPVRGLAWSPNGSMIVAGGNGDITVYDADTLGILSHEVNAHTSRVNDVAFSPDNSKIASGGDDGALKLWQAPSPSPEPVCGNSIIEAGEVCDGSKLGGQECGDLLGCVGGILLCNATCDAFDTTLCTGSNSFRDSTEECDGLDFGAPSCSDFDCGGGNLSCNLDCTIDPSSCSSCCAEVAQSCQKDADCCSLNCSKGRPSSRVCLP